MKRPLLLPLALLATLLTVAAAPGDWPTWRGANRDGHSTETGLLKEWPKDGPPLVWKATGLADGFASVTVSAGRIFTTGHTNFVTGDQTNRKELVLALDVRDGRILWSTAVGDFPARLDHPGSRVTPTVDGDVLFTVSAIGDFACIETATGKIRWTKQLKQELGGTQPGWGYSESPLVDGNLVVCTPGGARGAILAFNKSNGEIAWRSTDFKDGAQYAGLVPATIGGVKQYIQMTGRSVVGVAAADGKLLWKADRSGPTAAVPSPIYADNQLYATSGYGVGCNGYSITKDSAGFKVEPLWANKAIGNHHGGVIKVGDYVYGLADNQKLVCQDFKTGDEKWADRCVGKGAVAFVDGMLYCRSEGKGEVALVEASPDGYREKGRFMPPDRSRRQAWAHPVVAGGKLYLRDMDVLLCYDVKAK